MRRREGIPWPSTVMLTARVLVMVILVLILRMHYVTSPVQRTPRWYPTSSNAVVVQYYNRYQGTEFIAARPFDVGPISRVSATVIQGTLKDWSVNHEHALEVRGDHRAFRRVDLISHHLERWVLCVRGSDRVEDLRFLDRRGSRVLGLMSGGPRGHYLRVWNRQGRVLATWSPALQHSDSVTLGPFDPSHERLVIDSQWAGATIVSFRGVATDFLPYPRDATDCQTSRWVGERALQFSCSLQLRSRSLVEETLLSHHFSFVTPSTATTPFGDDLIGWRLHGAAVVLARRRGKLVFRLGSTFSNTVASPLLSAASNMEDVTITHLVLRTRRELFLLGIDARSRSWLLVARPYLLNGHWHLWVLGLVPNVVAAVAVGG